MSFISPLINVFESGGSTAEDVSYGIDVAANLVTSPQFLADAASGNWVAAFNDGKSVVTTGAVQGPWQSLSNIASNFGVFTIGFLLLLAGALWFSFSWGEDLVNAIESVQSKIPVPVE